MKRATVRDYGNDPVSFFRPSHKLSLSFRLDTVLELRDWVSFKSCDVCIQIRVQYGKTLDN